MFQEGADIRVPVGPRRGRVTGKTDKENVD